MEDNQQVSTINNGLQYVKDMYKKGRHTYALYKCPSCNREVVVRKDIVETHKAHVSYPKLCKQCAHKNGAQKRIKHGDAYARLYSIWSNMKSRTADYSPHEAYKDISVCDEWKNSYAVFKEWALANGYDENNKELSIDRIDPSKDYTPDNCRFLSLSENAGRAGLRDGRSKNVKVSKEEIANIIELRNSGKTLQEIAEIYHIGRTTVGYILANEQDAIEQVKVARVDKRKLTDNNKLEIKKLYAEGVSPIELSKKYNIAYSTVWNVIYSETPTTIPDGSTSQTIGDGSGELRVLRMKI